MSSQRLVINTFATYGRSVITMCLSLFSSRWILNSLGQSDFGLYSVVGSIILFIVFFNNVMAGSSARFFAFSMGEGNTNEANAWFNVSFSIHAFLATVIVIAGWPFGEYVMRHILNIPPERMDACISVFRISLFSAFISMISVPFIAMFTAKQCIAELAVWALLQSIASFFLAWSLHYVENDRFVTYAIGMAAIVTAVQIFQIIRASALFHECKFSLDKLFDMEKSKQVISFASWVIFGGLGMTSRDQGSAIIINLMIGPQVNASYGIASQVSSQANQLSSSMIGAFSPEITACEGRGDRKRVLSLSNQASKIGTILIILFAVPLMINMDHVLILWLEAPPPHTSMFCRFILATFLIDRLTTGTMLAINANGKIGRYQATVGTCLLLTLPIAWLLLKIQLTPRNIGIAFVITIIGLTLGRIWWGKRLLQLQIHEWITNVCIPCTIVAVCTAASSSLFNLFWETSIPQLIASCMISGITTISTTWMFALNLSEKKFIKQKTRHIAWGAQC